VLLVEVLNASKRVQGAQHPHTLISMHNLACTYEEQGRLQEAETLMAETVEMRRQVLGENNYRTLGSMQYLVMIQSRLREQRSYVRSQ
jgi:hypothetical protein